mmetsp:Transcript_31962/g.28325  ORF Transcript_31962/g.28325 Transcript_31962/m.28325 type:complete len:95 (-) Transcript_31962:89-373(-)
MWRQQASAPPLVDQTGSADRARHCQPSCLQLASVGDHNLLRGGTRLGAERLDLLHNVHAFGHGAKDNVLAVEPVSLDGAKEELRAVGIWASVGH